MSVHTSASRIRLLVGVLARSPRRSRTALAALLIGLLGVQEATAAATGQPVAYALTPNQTITVIDTGNHDVLRTIPLAGLGKYIVGAPDGKHIYVTGSDPASTNAANSLSQVVWVIDTRTYTVTAEIPYDLLASGLVISSDGTRVYVAAQLYEDYAAQVTVIDAIAGTALATINDAAGYSTGIAISPDAKRLYVPQLGGHDDVGALDVIDTATNTVVADPSVGTGSIHQFYWAAVSPDSSKVYTAASDDFGDTGVGGTFVIDAATDKQIGMVTLTGNLSTPLPNSSILYGVNGGGVTVFNTSTNTVVKTVPVATTIQNMAVTPSGKELYVSNSNAQSIAIIDTATNTVTGSIAVAGAAGLAIVAAPPPFVSVPPVINIKVSPTSMPPQGSATIDWFTSAATSCTKSGTWSGSADTQGNVQVPAPATPGNYAYTLTCVGPGGSSSASATLTVVAGSTLALSATDVPVNGSLVVTWQAYAGATDCQVSVGQTLLSQHALSGAVSTGPLAEAGTGSVSLFCRSDSGTISEGLSKSYNVYSGAAPAYASVALSDNLNAIGTAGTAPANGGIDGRGYAIDGQALQALPADEVKLFGQTITLGTASRPSAVWGQTVALGSVPLTEVSFVATAINGDQLNQKFVVTYSDGSSTTYTQSLSDWSGGPKYAGEDGLNTSTHTVADVAIGVSTRITPTGATQGPIWYLHKFRIPLDGTKVATSLQLPKNRDVIVFAVNVTKASTAGSESLASAFNVTALATAGQPSNGAVRLASGYAYDASLVPNGFTAMGQKFTIGAANQPDAVSNTTIALAAKARVGLTVLATGLNGKQPNQTFKVTYQDGSTTVFTQSVSDWNQPQSYAGEALARNTADRITPAGARQGGVWDLYAYTFQTDPGKQVVSLTLPNNRNVVVLAVNSLMK